MKSVTATILTYNEERHIEVCLQSLLDVVDEIVVVDSFSTDSTVDICLRYGCRVKQRRLAGYGAQRQYATSLASHNYILAIDADEALSPQLARSILAIKAEGFTHRVYSTSRLNFFCGHPVHHCGWYPDTQIRLFDRRYANWNLRDVDERVIFRDSVTPEPVKGDILHYRADTRSEFAIKERHHAMITARELSESCRAIAPLVPTAAALKAFVECYIGKRGFADGADGLAISLERFRCARLSYRTARKLKTDRQ